MRVYQLLHFQLRLHTTFRVLKCIRAPLICLLHRTQHWSRSTRELGQRCFPLRLYFLVCLHQLLYSFESIFFYLLIPLNMQFFQFFILIIYWFGWNFSPLVYIYIYFFIWTSWMRLFNLPSSPFNLSIFFPIYCFHKQFLTFFFSSILWIW